MDETIIHAAEILGAIFVIFGAIFAAYRWYLQQNQKSKDIKQMKEEQTLVVYAIMACLDGLEQLGANHTVPIAKDKLEKYINQQAHK